MRLMHREIWAKGREYIWNTIFDKMDLKNRGSI